VLIAGNEGDAARWKVRAMALLHRPHRDGRPTLAARWGEA
jgi:hypothetical protein